MEKDLGIKKYFDHSITTEFAIFNIKPFLLSVIAIVSSFLCSKRCCRACADFSIIDFELLANEVCLTVLDFTSLFGSRPIDFLCTAPLTGRKLSGDMSDLYWPNDAQITPLAPYFRKSHGQLHVDDRSAIISNIFSYRNDLRLRDSRKEYGPDKTQNNSLKRWSEKGAFAQIRMGLAGEHCEQKVIMI